MLHQFLMVFFLQNVCQLYVRVRSGFCFLILDLVRPNQSTLNLKTEMAKVSKREQKGGFALKLVLINCKIESIFQEAIMQNITTFLDKSFDFLSAILWRDKISILKLSAGSLLAPYPYLNSMQNAFQGIAQSDRSKLILSKIKSNGWNILFAQLVTYCSLIALIDPPACAHC